MATVLPQSPVAIIELEESYDSLDEQSIKRLQAALEAETQSGAAPVVVIDFARTRRIGSRCIGLLFAARKRLRQRQRQAVLCGMNQHCAEVLSAVRSDMMFRSYATRSDALAAVASSAVL